MDDLTLSPIAGRMSRLAGHAPMVDLTAWIAPTGSVIGDVEIGPQSGQRFNVVLRANSNSIRVGARTNLQDGTIVHVDPGAMRVAEAIQRMHAAPARPWTKAQFASAAALSRSAFIERFARHMGCRPWNICCDGAWRSRPIS